MLVVVQAPQTPDGHCRVCCCVIWPVKPAWQDSVRVFVCDWQVQVLLVVVHGLQVPAEPLEQVWLRVCTIWPANPAGQLNVCVSVFAWQTQVLLLVTQPVQVPAGQV